MVTEILVDNMQHSSIEPEITTAKAHGELKKPRKWGCTNGFGLRSAELTGRQWSPRCYAKLDKEQHVLIV